MIDLYVLRFGYALWFWSSGSFIKMDILQHFQNSVQQTINQFPGFIRAQKLQNYLEIPTH